jgi:hypothetical protein
MGVFKKLFKFPVNTLPLPSFNLGYWHIKQEYWLNRLLLTSYFLNP